MPLHVHNLTSSIFLRGKHKQLWANALAKLTRNTRHQWQQQIRQQQQSFPKQAHLDCIKRLPCCHSVVEAPDDLCVRLLLARHASSSGSAG
jgi:hypothetical protein